LGALIALAWARLPFGQVDRLALVSATPCFAQSGDWVHGLERGALLDFEEQLGNDYEGTMRRFIALQVLGDRKARRTARLLARHTPRRDEADMEALRRGLRILLETDLRAELAAVRQPTLVLHGDRDRVIPAAAGRFLASSIAGARFEVVTGAAHAPFLSNVSAVGRVLTEFFRG
jgi:pimeloyl-[acyl-carrier protein] methyl ester esterase